MLPSAGKHILMLVENATVPSDQRVWREARSVLSFGFHVSVVCPRGRRHDSEPYTELDGIKIHRYKAVMFSTGFLTYLLEYLNALLRSAWLIFKINRQHKIDAFHVANPPDLFFTIIFFYRLLGAKYIFDIHDLFVNTFQSKYRNSTSIWKGPFIRLLRIVEKLNIKTTDLVIVTNESYKDYIAHTYHMNPLGIFVVRNAPMLDNRESICGDERLKRGRKYLLVYFGLMGDDDGVDLLLLALSYLVKDRSFDDFHCAVIGPTNTASSPAFPQLIQMRQTLGLTEHVQFTDFLPWSQVHTYLNTADLGLSPDPFTVQNDTSTMIKILEYMSHGLPIVSFNLKENRFSGGDAAVYCEGFHFREFGDRIVDILNDDERRRRMSEAGRLRYRREFNWTRSEQNLRQAYANLFLSLDASLKLISAAPGFSDRNH